METERTQPVDTGAEPSPLYLTNRDPDDETDAVEVEVVPEQIAA